MPSSSPSARPQSQNHALPESRQHSTVIVIAAGGKSSLKGGQQRAIDMLAEHKGNGDSVYLPAAAFAECCHLDPGLFKLLRVLTLNAGAARLANQLFPPFLDERKKLKAKTPIKRKEVCIDAMILATAEVAGAELLYTTDDWFERVAKRAHLKVDVRTLPELRPKQLVLKEPTPEEEELAASVAEGDEAEEEEEREQERLEP